MSSDDLMVKEFQSIVQIKQYYRMKEKADMLAKRNYYLGRTKMVLGVSGLLKKYEKKLATFEKNNTIKLQRKMEKAIEDFSKGKKTETKTKKTENYTKGLALMQIQLYAKISRADKNGMVKEITTGKKVHRKETQGGHFISAQWNSTCFDLYNIRPQLKKSNFDMSQGGKQAELEREKYRTKLIRTAGIREVKRLENLRDEEKRHPENFGFSKKDYKEIYLKYKALNDEIFTKHPDWER